MKKDIYKSSRVMYIIEAALEYFISMMVTGVYLAQITDVLGLDDQVTGVLAAFATLGCSFQIFAIFIWKNRRVKWSVTVLHIINQLLFTLMYVVPIFNIPTIAKAVIFIIFILMGHVLNNLVQSPKINWYMSLVDDNKRGRFTANKEIISLISGMIFSFVMGSVIDICNANGKTITGLVLCGITLLALTALHTLTMVFSKEKEPEVKAPMKTKHIFKALLSDTHLWKVVMISVLWQIANGITSPFLGTYLNGELGFSMIYASIVSAVCALSRALLSRPLGKFADKHSFAKMLNICFSVMVVAFTVNIFTVPANGKVFYLIYGILHAIGMAGINSGGINLIYENVSKEQRICALALKNTISGIAGFLTTLLCGELVKYIQGNGNQIFGIHIYAQQLLSAISAVSVIVIIIYLNTVVRKSKPKST